MSFVWDPKKSRANLVRHGIAFEDAVGIFAGPTLEQVDDSVDYGDSSLCDWSRERLGDYGDLHGRLRKGTPDYFGMEGGTA